MSKKDFSQLTARQRAELAAQVKRVREELGMTQAHLAKEAGVTRQSVGNIEGGKITPQTSTIKKVLGVLGLSPVAAEFSDETTRWLGIIGGIMDALPAERRAVAGQAAVNAVTTELVNASSVSGTRHNVDLHEINLSREDVDLAATTDQSSMQDQPLPNYEDESQDQEK